jgi:hypothetical protein
MQVPGRTSHSNMDAVRIIFRVLVNVLKDLPLSRRKVRAVILLRRRAEYWRVQELERMDRLRNPSKYRPV